MNKIDSIIFFDDLEDMCKFQFEDMTSSDYSKAAKRGKYEYWTCEQLLELKEKHPAEFDKIRSEYVLMHTLRNYNLTSNQKQYLSRIKRMPLDINTEEIRRITGLIDECHDFYRVPSDKYRSFVKYFKRYIDLKQADIEDILRNLHHEVFCKGCCSTDADTWRKTFLKFEFYNTEYKFACGRKLSRYGYPLIIYIVITEDLRTNNTDALVSFTSYDFEKLMLLYSSTKRVKLNYIKKVGSVYIVSVVARPYTPEDPFFEFFISEETYNKIMHLIDALTIRYQMKYPLQYRCDAYKTFVMYRSIDPINRGLPIPVDYYFAK